MSEQEKLPVCVLCGQDAEYYGLLVGCSKPCCGVRAALMNSSDWRRLMARPRLAPEPVEILRRTQDKLYCNISMDLKDAIRAALAALVEE